MVSPSTTLNKGSHSIEHSDRQVFFVHAVGKRTRVPETEFSQAFQVEQRKIIFGLATKFSGGLFLGRFVMGKHVAVDRVYLSSDKG